MDFKSLLYAQLAKVNPILDCFVSIGVTPEEMQSYINFNVPLTPKVLSQFPPDFKTPETLPMFCFPKGAKLVKSTNQESETFNFILTDEAGVQVFCAAMIIYECLGSAKEQAKIFRTETRVMDENFGKKSREENINLLNPFGTFTHERRSKSNIKAPGKRPIEEFENAKREPGFRFFSSEQWLVPKCLLLISKYPFVDTLKKILVAIFKLTRTHLTIPIECYIMHLFLLLPLPPRGCIEVVYQILNSVILLKIPPVNQLPLFDCNMDTLFKSLSINVVLQIFVRILLEDNIVFLSSSCEKLFACSYSLVSLIYPFKWCLVYVPILPCQLIDYLYSPVKYIYGIDSQFKDDVLMRCDHDDVCIVDLDTGKIEINDERINIHSKKINSNEKIMLPDHYGKKLTKKLTEIVCGKDNIRKRIDSVKTGEIRNAFFQFFVSIFQNYKQYLNFEKFDPTNIATYFDQEGFLIKNKTDKDFFKAFFKTQMFANFCDRNMRTTNMDQHFENLLFNEHIISKKNRTGIVLHKKPTLFISDTSQNIRSKYTVPLQETCFNESGSYFYYTFPELNYETFEKIGLPTKFHPKFTENTIHVPETRLFDRQRSMKQSKENSLYVIWLELWASCLWAQEEAEHNERISEVLKVLELMNNTSEKPTISIYTFLIEACFHVNPSIALSIFSFMNTVQVLVDAATVLILQKVISKLFSSSKHINIKATRHSLEVSEETRSKSMSEKIKKRVFNKKNRKFLASHAINMNLYQKCTICLRENLTEESVSRSMCCKQIMEVIIKVKIGIDVKKENSNIEEVKLLSTYELDIKFQELMETDDNKKNLDLDVLRENSLLFWNLIWHFNQVGLTYKFFVPYEGSGSSNCFRIMLVDDENRTTDITPKNNLEKDTQTVLETRFLLSILG